MILDFHALRERGFAVATAGGDYWRVSGYGIDTVLAAQEADRLLGKQGDTLIRHASNPDVASAALRLAGKGYTLHESEAGNVWRVSDNDGEKRVRSADLATAADTYPVLPVDGE